jgi:hypothetical protein
VIPQQIQIHFSIGVAEEHLLPPVAALRDVMRPTG